MERLYRRRVPVEKVITTELARTCAQLSHDTRRQIGLLIDRRGHVHSVILGNHHELVIPNLSRTRSGQRRLRGVRFVHTHLNNQPLTRDDLTDLALLRLDLIMAIGVGAHGDVLDAYVAHIPLPTRNGSATHQWDPCPFFQLQVSCHEFIQSLEQEHTRTHTGLREHVRTARAILVSVATARAAPRDEYLEELRELVRASQMDVIDTVVQRPHTLHPKYVLGLGKLKEVVIHALQEGVEWLIFDRDLTPGQVQGIAEVTELRVLDRTQVILDIFARRAHSRIGKVQVELAQHRYRLPRLSQSCTALSRLAGGIGARGPGEMKLETDRRRARDRIRRLEKELDAMARGREQQRNMRRRHATPVVSLVGYTNAGKSTLLNALTGSAVPARDRVFETLDTVSRRLYIPGRGDVIVTDTVGFIRDLPEDLLSAFHTTLHELEYADLLIHVVDGACAEPDRQMQAVESILDQLNFSHIPRLVVLNKCDQLDHELAARLCHRYRAIGVSAMHKDTVGVVKDAVSHMIRRLEGERSLCRTGRDARVWRDTISEPVVTW